MASGHFEMDAKVLIQNRPTKGAVQLTSATPAELVERARALRPHLRARQQETEDLTWYPESTHEDFRKAGFYRILEPRTYGGYGYDLWTFSQVIIEIARGCPSTAWCYAL